MFMAVRLLIGPLLAGGVSLVTSPGFARAPPSWFAPASGTLLRLDLKIVCRFMIFHRQSSLLVEPLDKYSQAKVLATWASNQWGKDLSV